MSCELSNLPADIQVANREIEFLQHHHATARSRAGRDWLAASELAGDDDSGDARNLGPVSAAGGEIPIAL